MSISKTELEALIDTQLADNTTGAITEAVMRTVLKAINTVRVSILEQTAATLTLVDATHNNTIIRYNNDTDDLVLTLPNSLPVGFMCSLQQVDVGTIVPTGNVVNRFTHTESAGVNSVITLTVVENSDGTSAVYVLTGDTA